MLRNLAEDSATLRCPQCQQGDLVAKVSGVYSQSTSTGIGFGLGGGAAFGRGGTTPLGAVTVGIGYNRTGLAGRLAPPRQPGYPLSGGIGCTGLGCGTLFVLAALGAGSSAASSTPAGYFLVGIALLAVGFWLLQHARRVYEERKRAWEQSEDLWGRLFYCGRCDGVFLPGQSELLSPEQVWPR